MKKMESKGESRWGAGKNTWTKVHPVLARKRERKWTLVKVMEGKWQMEGKILVCAGSSTSLLLIIAASDYLTRKRMPLPPTPPKHHVSIRKSSNHSNLSLGSDCSQTAFCYQCVYVPSSHIWGPSRQRFCLPHSTQNQAQCLVFRRNAINMCWAENFGDWKRKNNRIV